MPLDVLIRIPQTEYDHFSKLSRLKISDFYTEFWTVLNRHSLIINTTHEVRYAVYNTPLGLAYEYCLLNRDSNREVDSSDIFFDISEPWLFNLRGESYRETVNQPTIK